MDKVDLEERLAQAAPAFSRAAPLIVGVFIMSFVFVADKMPKAFPTLVAVR